MLPRFWLLTLLAPLALGVPVPQKSGTPSVRLSTSHTETSNGLNKLGLNRADKASWRLKGQGKEAGSKTTFNGKGSPSLGGYAAHGTGISYSQGTASGTTTGTKDTIGTTGTTTGGKSTISSSTTGSEGSEGTTGGYGTTTSTSKHK